MENKPNMPSTSRKFLIPNRKRKIEKEENTETITIKPNEITKRKIENEENTENITTTKPEEVAKPSNDNVNKLETVLEYTKRSRLDFNFWDNLQDSMSNTNDNFLEIKNLRIGNYTAKPLKIRVTFKSNLRPSRSGFVLNIHAIDRNTSQIAMVNFGSDSVQKNEVLKINSVYLVENFSVETENVSFPSGTGNALQIKLNSQTQIQLVDEDDFPKIDFNFIETKSIQSLSYNDKVDILGVLVKDHGISKNYRNSNYRDLVVTDKSKGNAFITLWGADALNFDCQLYSVILIRRGSISIVDDKNKINCLYGTLLWCNPELSEALDIKTWFTNEISNSES